MGSAVASVRLDEGRAVTTVVGKVHGRGCGDDAVVWISERAYALAT